MPGSEGSYKDSSNTSNRKVDHIRICLNEDVQARGISVGLEEWRFVHQAFPELDLSEVDLSQKLFGKTVHAPIIISSMTGGAEWGATINYTLAQAAQKNGLAMGVGSQRAAIESPELSYSYALREDAPDVPLFANLGAVQLNYGYGLKECLVAIEMLQADALILHLNALQEAVQPNGNGNFKGLFAKIAAVCEGLASKNIPVIVKEVGNGLSLEVAKRLLECGVTGLDVSGSGGTSWSQVESYRVKREVEQRAATAFADWGIPTAQAILWARQAATDATSNSNTNSGPNIKSGLIIIGSGGIRNGVDVAKALALGADAAAMALPFLKAAQQGVEAVNEVIEQFTRELRIAMFCIGAENIKALQDTPHLIRK